MSEILQFECSILTSNGENYIKWAMDIKKLLREKGLSKTIEAKSKTTSIERYMAAQIMRQHFSDNLKKAYHNVENPLFLWEDLRDRYDYQRKELLSKAYFEWQNLSIHDYKTVDAYCSALFKIVTKLRLCDEEVTERDLIVKTLSGFHYTERNEDHNQGNHKGNGRGHGSFRVRGGKIVNHRPRGQGNRNVSDQPYSKKPGCHNCGMKNHEAHKCYTPKHLVDLYQEDLEKKFRESKHASNSASE